MEFKHNIPEKDIEYVGSVHDGQPIVQINFGKAGVSFLNSDFSAVMLKERVVAIFRLRTHKKKGVRYAWRSIPIALALVAMFASCKKSNGVEFTTFNGVPAGNYQVVVEAQQTNASSIWSPVSSITIAK